MVLDLPDWTTRVSPASIQPVVWVGQIATSVAVELLLVPGVVGKRIELVALMLVTAGTGLNALRGIVISQWALAPLPGGTTIALAAISPEKPSDFPPVPPGAMLSGVGNSLFYTLFTAGAGLGSQTVYVGAMYRLV